MSEPAEIPSAWQPLAPGEPADTSQAVTVAFLHGSTVSYSWHHSMTQLIGWDMANRGRIIAGGYISLKCGTDGIVEGRNQAVREFLADGKADWLWWVDADMGFGPDTVDRLFGAADPKERPIVGGLCFAQRELELDGMGGHRVGAVPTIYDWATVNEQQGFAVRWDYPPDTLTQCGGTGSACLLVHRSVFERIAERFGQVWYVRVPNHSTGQLIGEDLSFCVRAGALEIPIFVHTGVPTTHHKESWIGEAEYWRQRAVDAPPAPTPAQEAAR